MAIERNFQESAAQFESDEDVLLKQKWKINSAPTTDSENTNGSFECNICLDSAHDPVVTLCGHLYCWPCIYKWLHVQSSTPESDQQHPTCPICKANISPTTLVPLYGRGPSQSESKSKRPNLGLVIPHRPRAGGLHSPITTTATSPSTTSHPSQQLYPNSFQPQSQSFHHQQYFPHPYGSFAATASSNPGGAAMTSVFNPMIGMFGEMVYARMFGSSDTSLFAYPYPNSYPLMVGSSSPRMRRQEMQVNKSLNRVFIFLFCCIVLCLIAF